MCNAFQSEAPRTKRSPATSFVGRFEANAELLGEERLYSWLTADASEEATLSYAEMRARCRAVCVALRRRWGASTNDRLMLVYAPGLELLVAFFGCQYAAVIAVPYYPPVLPLTPLPSVGAKRLLADGLAKVKRIAESCTPHAFLSTRTYVRASWLASKLVREAECSWPPEWTWRCTDEVSPRLGRGDADWLSEWLPGRCEPSPRDEVSFLQYTSGSTGHPKGVAIGTRNLLANVLAMSYSSTTTNSFPPPGSRIAMVSWLPQYHDFGLIAGSLSTAMQGYRSDLLSPFTFIKHPMSWLLAISRLQHSHLVISPSPNFGFALCTRRAKPHHIAKLQLSHWKAAFNGAEPIRTRTLADFDAKFAPCGWHPSSWACLYGLAETCVYGCGVAEPPVVLEVPRSRLGPGDAPMPLQPGDDNLIEFPGCFVEEAALTGQRFAISHPETGLPLPDGVVGEVRIRGASVALGYWQQPELSEQTFRTPLALPAPPSALREEKGAAVGERGSGGAADGRKAEPAQKLRVPLDAVLHFWRDAGKPARKAAEPDAEPDPAAGGGLAVSLQEGSEKVQLPVRSVPRNDSELSALGTARGSEPSREPSRGDAAGKAEAELDDAGGGGPSATEQLGSGAELDSLDGERREAGREMMLAAAEGAAEAGCSPGMGWALRRTYLLAWGLHIPADGSLHATSAPAGGRASGSELGSCVEGLAELLHGCNLSGSMAAAGAWFEEQGLDTVAELKKARMEADFVAALQLKPGKERVLLADIDSFY